MATTGARGSSTLPPVRVENRQRPAAGRPLGAGDLRVQSRSEDSEDGVKQEALFEGRFLDNHAGSLVRDPITALIELVANCWDAGATRVNITWPNEQRGTVFSIQDDGEGMTANDFTKRWRTLSYDRREHQPPVVMVNGRQRKVFGRNGRGRHAAFLFGTAYIVTTKSRKEKSEEVTFRVSRGTKFPIHLDDLETTSSVGDHGTRLSAEAFVPIKLTVEDARAEIGSRFLHDPDFTVFVDDKVVTFEHLPDKSLAREKIDVEGLGSLDLLVIDAKRSDRSSKHHGVSWRVQERLVGDVSWRGLESVDIDRRTVEAKRYSFIVLGPDKLGEAVQDNWEDGFRSDHPLWLAARDAVAPRIIHHLDELTQGRRDEAKAAAKERNAATLQKMPRVARARWNEFVDRVVVECRSVTEQQVIQLATIMANLEQSRSRYGLIEQLSTLDPKRLDDLHGILDKWSVDMARGVLDEIQGRLTFIHELRRRMDDPSTKEVQELQPMFERGLWLFGLEFESIEYTSNEGMTTVIRRIFGDKDGTGSLLRPDYVIRPDGTVGLYSCPRYDDDSNVSGVDKLVIVELKKPGVRIGESQKGEVWTYVKELMEKGHITDASRVDGFVLGSHIDPQETRERRELDGRVKITPMLFQTALTRAERRMMNLYAKVKDAPLFKRVEEADAAQAPVQRSVAQ